MPVTVEALGIDKLTVAERLELIDQIWDTIPADAADAEGEGVALPDWQVRLLEGRLAAAEANPGAGRPYREVLDELQTPQ